MIAATQGENLAALESLNDLYLYKVKVLRKEELGTVLRGYQSAMAMKSPQRKLAASRYREGGGEKQCCPELHP